MEDFTQTIRKYEDSITDLAKNHMKEVIEQALTYGPYNFNSKVKKFLIHHQLLINSLGATKQLMSPLMEEEKLIFINVKEKLMSEIARFNEVILDNFSNVLDEDNLQILTGVDKNKS